MKNEMKCFEPPQVLHVCEYAHDAYIQDDSDIILVAVDSRHVTMLRIVVYYYYIWKF